MNVSSEHTPSQDDSNLFVGQNTETARLVQEIDWANNPLGPQQNWPQSLQTALSICLNSRFPMAVIWGDEFVLLYNDAYRLIAGNKHPWALGQQTQKVWSEIWDPLKPLFDRVMEKGEATWAEDMPLFLNRSGYLEECYFTFSCSPILKADGQVGGIFITVTETTEEVLSKRRLHTVRHLLVETHGLNEAMREAAAVFNKNQRDVPFSLIYLVDQDESVARLAGTSGLEPDLPVSPSAIDLTTDQTSPWPLAKIYRSGKPLVVRELADQLDAFNVGPWPEPPKEAMVLPVHRREGEKATALLVLGINARKAFDPAYYNFFEDVAQQLTTSITNVHVYEEEHQRAEALAELDRAKTAFFSNISHELRTPLTLMLGPLADLKERALTNLAPADHQELEIAYRNALRLLKLVDTMLEFSRLEAGRLQAYFQPTNLSALTADLVSTFRSAVEKAGLNLIVNCPPLKTSVYVDREMWEKIVLNLLSNALKYTRKGEVEVSVTEDLPEQTATLAVRDTGIGIAEKEIPRLFERFHRIEDVNSRSSEGTGIGLALVKELIGLHQGQISVESSPGVGSTFKITLPLGKEHLPEDQTADPDATTDVEGRALPYLAETLRWISDEQKDAPAPSNGRSNLQRGRILFVDDNADMRAYVRRILSGEYAVETTNNAQTALDLIQQRQPDLVLADVMMPGMDGFEFLRTLRQSSSTATLPVILLSARASEDARVEGLEAGANDYLAKPFSPRELKARIDTQLESAWEALKRERALRLEAQEAQERVLAGLRDGFIRLDNNWKFLYVNEQAAQSAQKPKEELLGRSIWEVFPDAVDTRLYQRFHQALEQQTQVHFEYFHASLDRWMEYRVSPSTHGLTVFQADISERKQLERKLLKISEQEKRDLGEALHDGLGQLLTGTAMLCQSLTYALSEIDSDLADTAEELQSLLQEARAFNRNLMEGMLPVQIEQWGLATALQRLVDRMKKLFDVTVELKADPELETNFDRAVVTGLYRIAQEAVTNAIRYGEARRVELTLTGTPEEVQLQITHSGKPPSEHLHYQEAEVGVHLMEYRSRLLGGTLDIRSGTDQETIVALTVPQKQ